MCRSIELVDAAPSVVFTTDIAVSWAGPPIDWTPFLCEELFPAPG